MERPTRTHEKKSRRQAKAEKTKQQPIKVVYISNPMRIEASVDEFRAVVQELTGQDSDLADFSKYGAAAAAAEKEEDAAAGSEEPPPPPSDLACSSPGSGAAVWEPPQAHPDDRGADLNSGAYGTASSPVEGVDGVPGLMLDDFPGFLPSPLYYEL